jgi:hypothetical protein
MPDESAPPLSARMLRRLEVAGLICSAASSLAAQANVGLSEQGVTLTRRDRVLIGLALKIERSLVALCDDCRAQRSEAMHHLKTMAECFIYFYAVLHDETETTTRQLLAKVLQEEARFLRENKGDTAEIAGLDRDSAELLAGGLKPLPSLRDLAEAAKVRGWYVEFYRMACEPAHIGDVLEFMPFEGEPITVGGQQPGFAVVRASQALWYGGQIALTVMRSICEMASVDLRAPLDDLARWFDEGSAPGAPAPAPAEEEPPHPEFGRGFA